MEMFVHMKGNISYVRTLKLWGFALAQYLVVFGILVALFYPVQRDGMVRKYYTIEETIPKKVLKKAIYCDFKIGNNKEKDWSFTALGDNLIIVVDISSTEEIVLKVESMNRNEINQKANIFYFNRTIEGPSLVLSLYNPWEFWGEKAELDGSIKIYHVYNETIQIKKYELVPGKVWTIWWIPILFG